MKQIELNSIAQKKDKTGVRIQYQLTIDEKKYSLDYYFYGVDCEIDSVPERFDPIAVLFLHAAIRHGYDLKSQYPISQDLYYSLTKQVIPQLVACNKDFAHEISINAPLTTEVFHGNWVGTGVSCGVDSLSTIAEYSNIPLEDFKLTHLLYLKVGQHSEVRGHTAESKTAHFLTGLEIAKAFCKEAGFPLIIGESNYAELVEEVFGACSCVPDVVYRNAGSILILQNYFSRYFYANSYPSLLFFSLDMEGDNAKYDRWLLPNVSNESIRLYSANTNLRRIDKVAQLSDFPLSTKYLTVCWRGSKNCGWCNKCIRTMLELDVNGLLDKYGDRFDLEVFRERKRDLYTYVYSHRKKDLFWEEIAQAMEKKQYMIPTAGDYMHLLLRKLKDRPFPYSDPYKK